MEPPRFLVYLPVISTIIYILAAQSQLLNLFQSFSSTKLCFSGECLSVDRRSCVRKLEGSGISQLPGGRNSGRLTAWVEVIAGGRTLANCLERLIEVIILPKDISTSTLGSCVLESISSRGV